ncbi:hypothetical protein ACJJTC_017872, partial [Scirpophaga incertulas]
MSTMYSCCEGSKEEELKLVCVHCGGMFHGSCIDPTSSRNVASIDKKNWICPSCAAKRPKEVKSDNTPIRSSTQKSTPSDNVTLRLKKKKTASESTVKDKSQDAVNVVSETADSSSFQLQLREIIRQEISELRKSLEASFKDLLNSKFAKIQAEINEMKKTVLFVNDKYDEIKKNLNDQEKSFKAL